MQLLYEFRYPTRWYSKLVAATLALCVFFVVAAASIAGYLLYGILAPRAASPMSDIANFPGHPESVSFAVAEGPTREGWFFPGLKAAPTIILCPGYQVNREELLPLATALQEHEYNVLLFDFAGKTGAVRLSLGFHELEELRSIVSVISERTDIDRSRFGIWGTNMGSYTGMALAEADPRVRAVAVESVYDRPQQMLHLLVGRYGVATLPLLARFAEKGFLLLNYADREVPPLSAGLSRLNGVPKLFIEAVDEPELMDTTRDLFVISPGPKEQTVLAHGQYSGMVDEEKRSYENRIVSFFLANLPLESPIQSEAAPQAKASGRATATLVK